MLSAFIFAAFSAVLVSKVYLLRRGAPPLSLFLCVWLTCLCISLLDPAGLSPVRSSTYALLVIHVVAFSAGYLVFSRQNIPIQEVSLDRFDSLFSSTTFQVLLAAVLVYFSRRYENAVAFSDIADARSIRFSVGTFFNSQYEYIFFTYGVATAVYISLVVAVCNFYVSGRLGYAGIATLANALIYSTIGYGRLVIFDLVLFFAIGFALRRPLSTGVRRRPLLSTIALSLLLVCASVFSMVWMTASRLNISIVDLRTYVQVAEVTSSQAVIYFTGPFRALDFFLVNIADQVGLQTLGRATFSGLEEIVSTILAAGDMRWRTANDLMSQFTVPEIMVGADVSFNAFYTGVMNFYLDGGLLGVIIFSFGFGATVSLVFLTFLRSPSSHKYAFAVFVTYLALVSQYRLPLANPVIWIVGGYLFAKAWTKGTHGQGG